MIDDSMYEGRDVAALDQQVLAARPSCIDCSRPICGHDALISIVLGFSDGLLCIPCCAEALGRPVDAFVESTRRHVMGRDCFREVWLRSSEREGFGRAEVPGCIGRKHPAVLGGSDAVGPATADVNIDDRWDAADMGCGDLVLALRIRLKSLPPGAVLAVRATDPGAPADIPAWCRLTGNPLLRAEHPDYVIRRKVENP